MALPEAPRGSGWTAVTARRMFPLPVWCAEQGKKTTYGPLDTELQRRGWGHHVNVVVYGHPAGAVGNACIEIEKEIGEKIPPLNALVVNAKSGIPGTGCDYYLATYLDKNRSPSLTDAQRKAMAEETMEEVWRFQKLDEILNRCGLKPIQGSIPSLHFTLIAHEKRLGSEVGPLNQKAQNIRRSRSGWPTTLRYWNARFFTARGRPNGYLHRQTVRTSCSSTKTVAWPWKLKLLMRIMLIWSVKRRLNALRSQPQMPCPPKLSGGSFRRYPPPTRPRCHRDCSLAIRTWPQNCGPRSGSARMADNAGAPPVVARTVGELRARANAINQRSERHPYRIAARKGRKEEGFVPAANTGESPGESRRSMIGYM
jgi:hypothetical protein